MTSALKRYQWTMKLLGVVYIVVGLIFFFFPREVFYLINVLPDVFHIGVATPAQTEHFWLVLATSMMMMLSALSFLAASEPRVRGYPMVHALSKGVSTAGFFYQFLHDHHYAAYLAGILTDFPLFVLVLYVTVGLRQTRPASEPKGVPA
ncbi:MAG: hypothetical protein ACXWPM_03245 [Bdellovibrionota bacterium]